MADYYGLYDELVNTSYQNMPDWMRTETTYMLFKVYDNIWQPVMSQMFPKAAAPSANGAPVSIDTPFLIPNTANPQYMSRHYDVMEMPDKRSIAYGKEEMQARLSKEWGPTFNPLEYANEWRTGFLDRRNQMLVAQAMQAMERFQEYRMMKYAKMDTNVMADYGNQYAKQANRTKTLDLGETSSGNAKYLHANGKRWDEADATPLTDILDINRIYSTMANEEMTLGMIGINTATALEKSSQLTDLVKYHYDAVLNKIGMTIRGVTMKKIIGQTYKDDVNNAGKLGYPGLGDVRADDWGTRKKFEMMRHTVNGTTYEYGIFSSGPIGNLFFAKTHPDHGDVTVPFANEWEDPRTKWKFSEMQVGFCPYVYDFSKVLTVERMSVATV